MDLPSFTGEFGGLLAGAWIAGFAMGWGCCVKVLLTIEREKAEKLEQRLERINEKIEAKFWNGQ